jgi:hypothetical protein
MAEGESDGTAPYLIVRLGPVARWNDSNVLARDMAEGDIVAEASTMRDGPLGREGEKGEN